MEKETILGTLIRQLELSGFQELARVSGVPLRTLVRYDQQLAKEGRKTISSWKAENIIKLANTLNKTPGEFLDWLLGKERYNGLLVSPVDQTIQGVPIGDHLVYEELLNALLINSNLGYVPTTKDIEEILKKWKKIPKSTLKEIRKNYMNSVIYSLAQSQLKPTNTK